jgi:alpha-glucosidase
MSALLPFFRAHAHLHAPDQEPWSWGEPYLGINRRWIEHRYRLLPYLYTASWQCAQAGVPIARPLLLAFQDDPTTHALDDQFMCGDHLLVAPILEEGATHRSVTLPAGGWYDVWSDELWMGPARVEVEAPLERIPIFARAGGVVPTAPAVRHVGERPLDRLILHVYPPLPCAEQDARYESVLYEDDGETLAYQEGEFLLTRFTLSSERDGARQGKGAKGAPLARLDLRRETEGRYRPATDTFEVVIHGVARLPRIATCDGKPIDSVQRDESHPALRLCVGPFKQLVLEWA